MTRYPGRSTGIGAERPPLPNVLPVPATLGTPITEATAIVRMCFLLIYSSPPPFFLILFGCDSALFVGRQFPSGPKGFDRQLKRICLSVVAFCCDVVLYLIDSVSFPIACCILTFPLMGAFSPTSATFVFHPIDYASQRPNKIRMNKSGKKSQRKKTRPAKSKQMFTRMRRS